MADCCLLQFLLSSFFIKQLQYSITVCGISIIIFLATHQRKLFWFALYTRKKLKNFGIWRKMLRIGELICPLGSLEKWYLLILIVSKCMNVHAIGQEVNTYRRVADIWVKRLKVNNFSFNTNNSDFMNTLMHPYTYDYRANWITLNSLFFCE